MNNLISSSKNRKIDLNLGFTLLELIIVIVILGILSVSVAPKIFSSNGFSEFGYRADVISKLRLIQLRAMQQGTDGCFTLTSSQLGKVSCEAPHDFVDQSEQRSTLVEISSEDTVSFSPTGTIFTFDSMGRPQPITDNEAIKITITGEQPLDILIEPEGYIHAI